MKCPIELPLGAFEISADPNMYDIRQGYYLRDHIPGTEMVVFEQSGHCPMLEEPERFNREIDAFASRVFGV